MSINLTVNRQEEATFKDKISLDIPIFIFI